MQYVNCNICNIDDVRILFQAKDLNYSQDCREFNIVQCRNCGLVYLNPCPTKEEIKKFYPDNYYINNSHELELDTLALRRENERWLSKILEYKKFGKILDIGCKRGDFLNEFKKMGWDTCGIEISPLAAQYGQEKYGLNIITGDLLDISLPEGQFDVVTLLSVFEHLHYPLETLLKINHLLKDDGLLVICLPNFDSFQARIFRDNWFHLDAPRHLFQLSTRTTGILLEKASFTLKCINHFNFFPNYVGLRMSLLYWFGKKSREKEASKAMQGKTYKPSFLKPIFNSFCKILSIIENILKHGGTIIIYATKTPTVINASGEKDKFGIVKSPYAAHMKCISLTGENKIVLDVGCATGYLSRELKNNYCYVVGLERDKALVRIAQKYCDVVIVGDAETMDLPYKNYFDVILFADVLAYFKYPKDILIKFKEYLKKDGYLVISVPNVANWFIRLSLLFGNFNYGGSNILYYDNLRFFTIKTFRETLTEAGFKIEKFDITTNLRGATRFGFIRFLSHLNKNLFAFQFIVKAVKS